jgi:Xaa-Pro aminopeptidase
VEEKGLAAARIGMELGFGQRLGMTHDDFTSLRAELPDARLESASEVVQAVRMIKSSAEVERVREACRISQRAIEEGFSSLREGMTEKQLAANLGSAMYREGAELGSRPSFLTVSSYPGRARMVNSLASDYELARGDMVLLDGGATCGGYATDFIRQACLGEPTDDQKRWFEICIEANDACIAAVRPGVSGADVYEAGLAVFARYGLADYTSSTSSVTAPAWRCTSCPGSASATRSTLPRPASNRAWCSASSR